MTDCNHDCDRVDGECMRCGEQLRRPAKVILFMSDARGQYIPRDFALEVSRDHISGVDAADLDYLARGPGGCLDDDDSLCTMPGYEETVRGQHYWDVWDTVSQNAVITDDAGVQFTVYQDGNCWLVEKGAEYDESYDDSLGFYFDVYSASV